MLYYNPANPSAFSTLKRLLAATKQRKRPSEIQAWLEKQDAYTLHQPVRKCFPRNPYSVNNLIDVWKSYLVYVQALSKYNDQFKYLLTVIDFFSQYLHFVPLNPAVMSELQSIFKDSKYSKPKHIRPLCERIRLKNF